MYFLDTQVISYAFKGVFDGQIKGNTISSIVASEFLLQQTSNPIQANYYIPSKLYMRPNQYHYYSRAACAMQSKRNFLNKFVTDKVVMEFGQEHETIVHFSNSSLAYAINTKKVQVFLDAISVVEKQKRKIIKSRFEFLLDHEVVCKPIGENTVQLGYQLLDEFLVDHNLKQNFRNSWNDILVFASALQASKPLITFDNELSKFIAARHAKSSSPIQMHFSLLDFEKEKEPKKYKRSESKGYINRGWRVIFKK